jgi:hypothetical protein
MSRKADQVIENVVQVLSSWGGVDTVTVLESGEDLYDPYFFLSLDVYYRDGLPGESSRRTAFTGAGAYETTQPDRKDRFLLEDIPIRLEYKLIPTYDRIVQAAHDHTFHHRETGTYVFYRLTESRVLLEKSGWLAATRSSLKKLDNRFWQDLRQDAQARMEHNLSDMYAAEMRQDPLFFLVSRSGFAVNLCSVLCALNETFEPSGRILLQTVTGFRVLPESFQARFEHFLSDAPEISRARKCELAQLMAKSVIRI